MDKIIKRLEYLGSNGLVVSIAYGPCGKTIRYSVDVMSPLGGTFEAPFAADTFEQCVEIAEIESQARGWI